MLSHIRLQHLECFKDDDVRADDIFLKGAEETKTESDTPDCTSAQEQIEILQLGWSKLKKKWIFALDQILNNRYSFLYYFEVNFNKTNI